MQGLRSSRTRNRGLVALLLGTALLGSAACTTPPRPEDGATVISFASRGSESFRSSNGRTIGMDVVYAKGAGPKPAVVMLHGAAGIGNGYLLYPHANAIADRGIHVFLVDYYDGIGAGSDRASSAYFPQRERVIADAVEHVRGRAEVDPDRVGLFGLSLGGFHALSLASQDSRLGAVVNFMGAMPQSVQADQVYRMPPTLIMHGSADRIVPPRRMAALATMLDRLGTPYEVKLYMGEGHTLGGQALADSARRSAAFFERHLQHGTQLAMLPH